MTDEQQNPEDVILFWISKHEQSGLVAPEISHQLRNAVFSLRTQLADRDTIISMFERRTSEYARKRQDLEAELSSLRTELSKVKQQYRGLEQWIIGAKIDIEGLSENYEKAMERGSHWMQEHNALRNRVEAAEKVWLFYDEDGSLLADAMTNEEARKRGMTPNVNAVPVHAVPVSDAGKKGGEEGE